AAETTATAVIKSVHAIGTGHCDRQARAITSAGCQRRSGLTPRRQRAGNRWIVAPPHIAATQASDHLLARYRLRIAGAMAARTPHQVDVDVVEMIGVRTGRKHGREAIAGCALHIVQKALLLRRAVPAALDHDR